MRGMTCCLPYEIVEMILTHVLHDLDTRKALSLTCRSWYIAAVPHFHRTFTFATGDKLRPLSKPHRLGLMPLIKEIWTEQYCDTWLLPQAFNRHGLRYFSAFPNIQTLMFDRLSIFYFIPGVERYFGHFSPTLRPITLDPFCTTRQLPHLAWRHSRRSHPLCSLSSLLSLGLMRWHVCPRKSGYLRHCTR